MPGDARIVKHFNKGRPRWDDETYLLADLIHVMSGEPHPARPKPADTGADSRETAHRARLRRERIAAKRAREKAEGLPTPEPVTGLHED